MLTVWYKSIPSPNFINLVFVGRIDNPLARYGKKVKFNPVFSHAGWHPALQNSKAKIGKGVDKSIITSFLRCYFYAASAAVTLQA